MNPANNDLEEACAPLGTQGAAMAFELRAMREDSERAGRLKNKGRRPVPPVYEVRHTIWIDP